MILTLSASSPTNVLTIERELLPDNSLGLKIEIGASDVLVMPDGYKFYGPYVVGMMIRHGE